MKEHNSHFWRFSHAEKLEPAQVLSVMIASFAGDEAPLAALIVRLVGERLATRACLA